MTISQQEQQWFEQDVLKRFLRYVKLDTTSDRNNTQTIPSTEGQWQLARLLYNELVELGIDHVELTDECFLIARVPMRGNGSPDLPTIGFMAHLDTAEDVSGHNVQPRVHHEWNGKPIRLGNEWVLDPHAYPALLQYHGQTIITTSGETLLGADNKAGIAEIMTAITYLQAHPEIMHCPIEIIITPDEENGMGIRHFPHARSLARYCYTIDGGDEGTIEAECFNAYKVTVHIKGYQIHPGTARGKLINPITVATNLLASLPQAESPEATDGHYGFYCPLEITGTFESARIVLYIRDFDITEVERRVDVIRSLATMLEKAYPGATVELSSTKQYLNMYDAVQTPPELLGYAKEAIRRTGIEPKMPAIRGGTDGAQMTEMGIPTPNIFTGAHNMHSRYEWIALPAMVRATRTILNLVQLWRQDHQHIS